MSYLDHTNAVDLYPYRTALRRYGLASITTHQYPTDAAALEQESAARALVEMIEAAARADERAKAAEEIAKAIEAAAANDDEAVGAHIARRYATRRPGATQEATEPPDAYPSEGAANPEAHKSPQEAVG